MRLPVIHVPGYGAAIDILVRLDYTENRQHTHSKVDPRHSTKAVYDVLQYYQVHYVLQIESKESDKFLTRCKSPRK